MTEVVDQETTAFPVPRTCPFDAPPEYRELREEAPISRVTMPGGKPAWVITRHKDVREVLTDPRFSSDRRHPNFPLLVEGGRISDFTPSLIGMDAPEHGPARRAVLGEFTVRRMEALRPRIQEIVDERIDAMLAGGQSADLVEALSLPVPSLVICELLGVPYEDHDFFQSCTSRMLRRSVEREDRQQGFEDLRSYLDRLVTGKEAAPGEDLLGRQVLKQREEGKADHDALVSLAFLLLLAGHETTANMISLSTLALLENPEQLAAITQDPAKTLPAVEELLRYFTIVDLATSRVAAADVEIDGVRIRAGDAVLVLSYSANRDPESFDRPDELDIERGARHHVAFGFGPHQCLGQNLARMELQVVFDTLFRRLPNLRVTTPTDELPFKHDSLVFGLHSLPVTW